MYKAYLIRRLLEALEMAEQAASAEEREVHLRASRYYRNLIEASTKRV